MSQPEPPPAASQGGRYGKSGEVLPDITPDSTEVDEDETEKSHQEPSPRSSRSSKSKARDEPQLPEAPAPEHRPPSESAAEEIQPAYSSDDGGHRDSADKQSAQEMAPAGRGGSEAGESMGSSRKSNDPSLFAGDEVAHPELTPEQEEHWLPLSSRMDLPHAENFLWENFELSGLPELAHELGSKRAWLKHRTEAEFRQALRSDSNDLPTLHRYALYLYNKKKDSVMAERVFQHCLKVKEDYVEVLIDYGVMCWLRWKMAAGDRKDVLDKHKAERMLRRAARLVRGQGPLPARAFSKLALFVDDALGQWEEALGLFKRAVECDPSNADHPHNLAVHLEESGDYESAAEHYKQAITTSPLHSPALSNYARLLHRHFRDRESALKFHQRAVRAAPYDPEICFNYAVFQEEAMHDLVPAKEYYDRAVANNIKDPSIFISAANFYLRRMKDTARCLDLYRRALRSDPQNISSLLSYARFLEVDRRDFNTATTYYQRALEVRGAGDELEAEALSEVARFMQEKCGETFKAREAVRKALEKQPTSGDTLVNCARCILHLDKNQTGAIVSSVQRSPALHLPARSGP